MASAGQQAVRGVGNELVSCTIVKAPAPGLKAGVKPPALKEVKLAVSVLSQADGSRVCCKSDGMRFSGGADTTVKLCTSTPYTLQITSSPAVSFNGPAVIRTRRAEYHEPSLLESCCCAPRSDQVKYTNMDAIEWEDPLEVPLVAASCSPQPGGGSGAKAAVEAQWVCDMEVTEHGFRGEMEIELTVQDYGRVLLPLQAKVYRASDTSAKHGVTLKCVDFLLHKHSITGEVRILATQYQK